MCGLSANTMNDKTYDYDTLNTNTVVYDSSSAFSNAKPTKCAITGCALYQSDCVSAIPAPMNTYFSVDTSSPFAIRVSQTKPLGYPLTTFCYKCQNSLQSVTA